MAYPPGVTTCPVSIKAPITFGGADATVHLEVTPAVRLVWAATGQTFADFVEQPAEVTAGTAAIELPHNQPGFQDEAGNELLSWPYTARVRFEHQGRTRYAPLKSFTIPAGQTAVDLALIPAGPAAPILTAPAMPVTSFNGQTGAVDTYETLARTPEVLIAGTITRDADGAPLSAPVIWPDGTAGTFTGTPSTTALGALDGWTITYGTTRTYAQPNVTRDTAGNVTNQPAIVIT